MNKNGLCPFGNQTIIGENKHSQDSNKERRCFDQWRSRAGITQEEREPLSGGGLAGDCVPDQFERNF